MAQVLSILFGLISALILVSFDVPLLGSFLEKYFFRPLNDGLLNLKHFEDVPAKGPNRSIIKENNTSFGSLLQVIKSYFPYIINRNQRIIGIVCESSLALSPESGGMLNPVGLWFEEESKLIRICSLNELSVLIRDYKQRILNRLGLFFLVLSLVLQVLYLN